MSEFDLILNYSNYYSKGEIEYGIDGPEIFEDKLYISIYHYLEYINENPHNYDTFNLGLYLFKKSENFRKCKYKDQNIEIDKYNLELLKTERKNFDKYKKATKTISPTIRNNDDYVSRGGYKKCSNCGEWHDANFPLCAPCSGKSRRNPSYEDDDY
jgi:hypothetical protein